MQRQGLAEFSARREEAAVANTFLSNHNGHHNGHHNFNNKVSECLKQLVFSISSILVFLFCFMWKHQSISFIISVLQMSSRHVHGIMHILEELIYPRCRKISILHKVGQMQADFCSMKMNITHSMTQLWIQNSKLIVIVYVTGVIYREFFAVP